MGPIVIFAGLLAFVAFGALLFYSKLRAIDARVRQEHWDREKAARATENLGTARTVDVADGEPHA